MPGRRLALLAALFAPATLGAQPLAAPAKSAAVDVWESAYLEGAKAGYIHYSVKEEQRDGKTILRASEELHLTVRRFGQLATIHAELGTEETTEGQVVAVFMKQGLAQNQTLDLRGTIENGTLKVKVSGQFNNEREMPWDDKSLSMMAERNYLVRHKPKPGETFSYQQFQPTVNAVITVRGKVLPPEDVPRANVNKKLLRVEVRPDKIQEIQLPPAVIWCDPVSYERVLNVTELSGLGELTTRPTTKAQALAPIASPDKLPDLGLGQSIRLNQRLANPDALTAVTYAIKLPKDDNPATAFAQDARQEKVSYDSAAKLLQIRVLGQAKNPKPIADAVAPGREFLLSNQFLNSDDPVVRKHAALAIGNFTEDWQKAVSCERWVKNNMRAVTFSEAMATADHVAKNLEGDCSEYAMLTAAMCKAAGVPARTALGLVYFERGTQPMLAFHMWTEVYARGQWLGIDATLGEGGVGPGHLKLTDHSWHNTPSLLPLLPVLRVLVGKAEIKIVEVRGR